MVGKNCVQQQHVNTTQLIATQRAKTEQLKRELNAVQSKLKEIKSTWAKKANKHSMRVRTQFQAAKIKLGAEHQRLKEEFQSRR